MRKLKIKISMTCVLGCVSARVIERLEAIEDYCVQRSSINWNAFDRSRYSKLCQKDEYQKTKVRYSFKRQFTISNEALREKT